jgi:hypothetical protein
MKTFNTKNIALAFASLFLFACERNEEQDFAEPMQVSQQDDLVGYDPTTCNLVQTMGTGTLPRSVSLIEEDRVTMTVTAQRRGHNGKYLPATEGLLLDPRDPATNMTNPFDVQMLGMYGGILTVPDETGTKANREGGRVILDFTPVGSVTMKTMLFSDIAEEDGDSKVELYSRSGQLLEQKKIPARGRNQAIFVSFDNVPGVAKAIVTFGDERKTTGSGAIARLQLCKKGEGYNDYVRSYSVHSLWLEYTGSQPANVDITARNGNSGKPIFSAKGMKPGTMFKLASSSEVSLGEELEITTNRRETRIIPMSGDYTTTPLKKQYGSFRIVEARDSFYALKLEE